MSREKKPKKEDIEKLRKILDSPDDPKIRKSISKDEKNLESIINRLSGEPKKTKYTSTDFLYKGSRSLEPRVTVHKKEEEISPPEIQKKEPELPKEEVTEEFPTTEEELFDDVELYEIEKVEISEHEFMEVKAKEEPKTDEVIFEETEPSLPIPKEETSIDEPLPEWEPIEEPKPEEKVETKEEKTIEKAYEFEEMEEKPEIPPKKTEKELPKWEPVEVIEEEIEKPSESYEEKLSKEEIEEISKEEKKKAERAEKEKKLEQKRKEKEQRKKEKEERKLKLLKEKRAKKNAKIQEKEAKQKEKERAREEKLKEKEQAKAEKKEKKFKKLEPEHKEIVEKDESPKLEREIIEEDAKLVDAKPKDLKLEGKLDIFNEIKSIDEKTAWLLYTNGFTSVEKLKDATVNDITKVKGIKRGVAKKIKKEVGTSEIEKEKITLPIKKGKRRVKKLKTEEEELTEWESYTIEEESPGLQPELSPFTYEVYTLYKKEIETASGKKRTIHFFSKKKPEVGEAVQLPDGYEVKINKRTRLPYLKKKK